MHVRLKTAVATAILAGTVALAGASSASALNAGTLSAPTGPGTLALSGSGGAVRIVVNSAVQINCASSNLTVTLSTGIYTAPAYLGSGRFAFGSCLGAAGFTANSNCALSTSFNAASVSTGSLSGISCVISFPMLGCTANVSGTVPMNYTNPTTTSAGVVTVPVAGQALAVSGSTCPPAILPNGTGQIVSPTLPTLSFPWSGAPSGHLFLS